MNVTREVILDLLPVYLAGEASPATRTLVEEFLRQDEELARRIRQQWVESLAAAAPSVLPPDLELRSLKRTRRLLGGQRWLFGFAIACTSVGMSLKITFAEGRLRDAHFVIRDYPQLGIVLAIGIALWVAYFAIRRRLRTSL